MNGGLAAAFRRAAVPLVSYYGVTLAVPIVNGSAFASPSFVAHAVAVLLVPPLLVAAAWVAQGAIGRSR